MLCARDGALEEFRVCPAEGVWSTLYVYTTTQPLMQSPLSINSTPMNKTGTTGTGEL